MDGCINDLKLTENALVARVNDLKMMFNDLKLTSNSLMFGMNNLKLTCNAIDELKLMFNALIVSVNDLKLKNKIRVPYLHACQSCADLQVLHVLRSLEHNTESPFWRCTNASKAHGCCCCLSLIHI